MIALRKGSLLMAMIPSKGVSISRIRNSAPETEAAQMTRMEIAAAE